MAANIPTTWAMMAGQNTPPEAQYMLDLSVFCSSPGT
jgi:hypothetical protein